MPNFHWHYWMPLSSSAHTLYLYTTQVPQKHQQCRWTMKYEMFHVFCLVSVSPLSKDCWEELAITFLLAWGWLRHKTGSWRTCVIILNDPSMVELRTVSEVLRDNRTLFIDFSGPWIRSLGTHSFLRKFNRKALTKFSQIWSRPPSNHTVPHFPSSPPIKRGRDYLWNLTRTTWKFSSKMHIKCFRSLDTSACTAPIYIKEGSCTEHQDGIWRIYYCVIHPLALWMSSSLATEQPPDSNDSIHYWTVLDSYWTAELKHSAPYYH